MIASTIENIYDASVALGYKNLTRDYLRVLDEWVSNNLPILIMPYWDNGLYLRSAHHTVVGGDACTFHLYNAYAGTADGSTLAGVFEESIEVFITSVLSSG